MIVCCGEKRAENFEEGYKVETVRYECPATAKPVCCGDEQGRCNAEMWSGPEWARSESYSGLAPTIAMEHDDSPEEWRYHLWDTESKANEYRLDTSDSRIEEASEVATKDGIYQGQWIVGNEVGPVPPPSRRLVHGLKHGYGRLQKESYTYQGYFLEGMMHGHGVLTWDDGRVYKGHFDSDKFHGNAVMKFPGGIRYCGQYVNGLKHGLGSLHFDAEYPKCFIGQFVEGKMDGKGSYTDEKGVTTNGTWHEDEMVSVDQPEIEPEKINIEYLMDGVWLCNNTFIEMARIDTDGLSFAKLTWTNKDSKSELFKMIDAKFNTSAPLKTSWHEVYRTNVLVATFCERDEEDNIVDEKQITARFQLNKFIIWENGEVWRHGPSEKCPEQWCVVDSGGAIVRSDYNLNNNPPQVCKLRKQDVMTVVEVRGRRARLVEPKEGWISIETDGARTSLLGALNAKPWQIVVPREDVKRFRSGSILSRGSVLAQDSEAILKRGSSSGSDSEAVEKSPTAQKDAGHRVFKQRIAKDKVKELKALQRKGSAKIHSKPSEKTKEVMSLQRSLTKQKSSIEGSH